MATSAKTDAELLRDCVTNLTTVLNRPTFTNRKPRRGMRSLGASVRLLEFVTIELVELAADLEDKQKEG